MYVRAANTPSAVASVGDTTEFVIGENAKLYLAAILDLFSRFVVGCAIRAVNDRRLTLKALEMAPAPLPRAGLLHHSDRGCTYTCEDYQTYLAARGIPCSMSRRADCYDNAVMESFFATVKKEEADRFPSYSDAKMALFDHGADTRRSAKSVRPGSSARRQRRLDGGDARRLSQVRRMLDLTAADHPAGLSLDGVGRTY
jgi:transposase InsO family protein